MLFGTGSRKLMLHAATEPWCQLSILCKTPSRLSATDLAHYSLSAVPENFVPQTGQVRASCCANPSSLPGSSTDPPDSVFTASLLQRRLAHRRARGKQTDLGCPRKPSPPPSRWCEIGPQHLPLSCRSLSSGTPLSRRILADREDFFTFFVTR